ncbi:MAG: hypothetical protein J3K34DRAFT_456569 [Monoraphidium minutum]|nr:MAG: hypothetical protein J3K34DRAFT_456569 [Monoraphidium minutum]
MARRHASARSLLLGWLMLGAGLLAEAGQQDGSPSPSPAATPGSPAAAASAALGGASGGNRGGSGRGAGDGAPRLAAPVARPGRAIAVRAVTPSSLTQFVPNRVTVDVNASLCGPAAPPGRGGAGGRPQQQQAAPAGGNATAPQLILRGARADGGDAAFPGNASANCSRLMFALTPGDGVRSGAFEARVAAPGGAAAALPGKITVVRPLTVGVADRALELAADGAPARLRVRLSGPSQSAVRVRLQLSDSALQVVGGDRLEWLPGQAGERTFEVRVASAPRAGRAWARLVDAEGGAVVPLGEAAAELVVLSPTLAFEPTSEAIFRGSGVAPVIPLRLSGASTFASSWAYATYFLNGSRPADGGDCRPGGANGSANASAGAGGYEPGCAADWDARADLSARGTIWAQPGQKSVPAIQLQRLEWERVPYEAEYMIGLRLTPLVNGRAAPQAADAAAVVYGTPPGHCPPGTAVRRGAEPRAADGPVYGATAALQELHFWVSGLGGPNGSAAAAAAAVAGGAAGNGSVLDLDPPFRPLTDRYVGLLPYTADAAELVISSTRRGDSVTVDAGGCDRLASRDYNVTWGGGARMWRARFGLRAQRRPCWLRVHVFTSAEQQAGGGGGGAGGGEGDGSLIPNALQPEAAAGDEEEGGGSGGRAAARRGLGGDGGGAAPPQAVEKEGVRRVLYRSYTLRFVPLSPPSALSLRSISFSNGSATLLACGVPSRLAHLFAPPPPPPGAAADGAPATAAAPGRPLPAPLVAAPGQRPQVVYFLNARAAADAAAAHRAAPGTAPPLPTQALFTLRDRRGNETVIWSELSQAECAPDAFVLAPLAQVLSLGPDARVSPELVDADAEGVKVGMSGAALALSPDGGGGGGGNGSRGGALIAPALALQDAAGAGGALAAAAAARRGGSRGAAADGGDDDGRLGGPRLPGASLELPVITTADDGLASKTYTLVLYSNISSAQALARLRPSGAAPNATPPDGEAAAAARAGGAAGSGSRSEEEEDARLRGAAFGARPRAWPASPGQSGNCSLCARGTYSTKPDARECQVCPPGKFSPDPYSTGCRLCPRGSFSYYWGADACRTCLPGTFAAARGSLYCDTCADGLTTAGEGAAACAVEVAGLAAPEYVMLLSFGVVLSGASLGAVSRDTTGINASSEGIVAVLVRSDTASALNVGLEAVTIGGVRQLARRRLLVNVSAAVPINTEDAAVADARDLSADALVQRLIEDPNAFMRTTQTLGAESAAITDLTTEKRHNPPRRPPGVHAVLWPTLAGAGLLAAAGGVGLRRWRRRRRARPRGRGTPGVGGAFPLAGGAGGGGGPGAGGLGYGGYEDGFYGSSFAPDAEAVAVGGSVAGYGGATGRRRGDWWGRLRGALGGGGGGAPPALELAYAGGGWAGGGGGDGPDLAPRASPREDSFATLLRQKQQQLLSDAHTRARRGRGGGGGGAGGLGCGGGGGGGGGGGADVVARDSADASSNSDGRGPPSDLADSAAELEGGAAGARR